ncbi:MFS transporter [Alloscardovia theropitheci]|uniref:MFS transporter n=1 Tax=Alloscardovia theropitheci TaxID=2496842 RepID=A0A4R0QTY5_9BIFI|nr:MFS transporter [Alloscardovia theropitheci]TCD55018.1 MFS transporter [Alloscardovia theropitheci]
MTALLVAIFAFQLNASMLSPALTTMEHELGATAAQIALTQTVFFTAAALFSLFLPRLADLAGRKKVLLGILIATTVGCVISALAPNVTVLMIGRILQGAAGPVVPMCLIMLHARVTEEKRYTRLMAILTSVNGGIAGVDALLGGWLAGTWGFRAVFWAMTIIAAIAIVLVFFFADESKASETSAMDWLGVFFLVVAMGALITAINEMQKLAGANWLFAGILVVVAIAGFVAFWETEKRKKNPMVSTHYMKQRRTWGLLLTTLLTMTGVFAVMNGIIPAIAQDPKFGTGMGANVVSFATLTPYALIGLAFGPVAGILASRFGYRNVLRVGQLVTLLGVALAIYVAAHPTIIGLVLVSVILGFSYAGTANIMLNGLGIVLSPADNPGYLPGLNAGAFNLGAGLSYVALYAAQNMIIGNVTLGYEAALITGLVLVVLALASSFLIPQPGNDE